MTKHIVNILLGHFAGVGLRSVHCGLVLLLSTGCATIDKPDPYEKFNRQVMAFNDQADRWVLKPVAKGYTFITPKPVRRSVHNFFDNLLYPTIIINQFLQGKGESGLRDSGRFLINTTLGIAGLFDVSTSLGLEAHEEDFGQTLAVWGVDSGAYWVVPVLGPLTTRSGFATIVDGYTHPIPTIEHVPTRNVLIGSGIIDKRASLLDAEALISGDRYLFIRDAYLQRREFLINDGQIETDPFFDE